MYENFITFLIHFASVFLITYFVFYVPEAPAVAMAFLSALVVVFTIAVIDFIKKKKK